MTAVADKIDQLVLAVLQAVDERIRDVRKQFSGLVETTNQHRAELAAWQQSLEEQQAELALRQSELTARVEALATKPRRANGPATGMMTAIPATPAMSAPTGATMLTGSVPIIGDDFDFDLEELARLVESKLTRMD